MRRRSIALAAIGRRAAADKAGQSVMHKPSRKSLYLNINFTV
jgi:hypothetical protein